MVKKKLKHNYTSELELKSLLIRIKNDRFDIGNTKANSVINKYIKWHTKINAKKYVAPAKRNIVKAKLKKRIVDLSIITRIDQQSYERFGEIILLMIKNILKKPQFSGYTYRDDFFSDAVYKILKYLHNFDHTKISERTGLAVNAFAYISQIIHNSILFIINTKKKDSENQRNFVVMETTLANIINGARIDDWHGDASLQDPEMVIRTKFIEIDEIEFTLIDEITKLSEEIDNCDKMEITYPRSYEISFTEYNELKCILKDTLNGKVNVMRADI